MNLNPHPFRAISEGKKTIELRLFDEKRRLINVGDQIVFTNTDNEDQRITVQVIGLHKFDSFDELYKNLPLLKCGYTEENINNAKPEDMESYYSPEKQKLYGVLGIEVKINK